MADWIGILTTLTQPSITPTTISASPTTDVTCVRQRTMGITTRPALARTATAKRCVALKNALLGMAILKILISCTLLTSRPSRSWKCKRTIKKSRISRIRTRLTLRNHRQTMKILLVVITSARTRRNQRPASSATFRSCSGGSRLVKLPSLAHRLYWTRSAQPWSTRPAQLWCY